MSHLKNRIPALILVYFLFLCLTSSVFASAYLRIAQPECAWYDTVKRILYVDLTLTNTGDQIAKDVKVTKISPRSPVTYNSNLSPAYPINYQDIPVGAKSTRRIYLNVPEGTTAAIISVVGQCKDTLGNTYSFSSGVKIPVPPVVSVTGSASPSSGYAPLPVSFSATTQGTITLYEWDFNGDGTYDFSSPSSPNTVYTYTQLGTFNATIRVTDSTGAKAFHTLTITVQNPLTATANASPTSGTAPLKVTFTGSGIDQTGTITKYEWDFNGDGFYDWSSAFSQNAYYTYSTAGTYNAKLRLTDNNGFTDFDTVVITVKALPKVSASANPTSGSAPLTVNFTGTATDADGTIVKYEWDFDGDGIYDWSSTATANTSYTYNFNGTFSATLKVTDNDGLSATTKLTIRVAVPGSPIAKIESATPTEGEVPLTVDFLFSGTDPDGRIVKYEWDFDGDDVFDWDLQEPFTAFQDDMEEGSANWTPEALWTLIGTDYHSPNNCWNANFPGYYYKSYSLTSKPIDISSLKKPALVFWHNHNLRWYNYAYVEISTDGGMSWSYLKSFYYYSAWKKEIISLASYAGSSSLQIRFRLLSTYFYPATWSIDDVMLGEEDESFFAFQDDMEQTTGNWTADETWKLINTEYHSPNNCWNVTLIYSYKSYSLTSKPIDISSLKKPALVFWHNHNLRWYNYAYVEISTDGGMSWSYLKSFSYYSAWKKEIISLASYAGSSSLQIRFRLYTYYYPATWSVDDVMITEEELLKGVSHTYTTPGLYTALFKVTDDSGLTGSESVRITANVRVTLSISPDSFNPSSSQTTNITTSFNGDVNNFTLLVKNRAGAVIRNLVTNVSRASGTYTDSWNGKDEQGNIVPDGVYYFVIQYTTLDGRSFTYDLTTTTGGTQRTLGGYAATFPSNFSPYDDQFCPITYNVPYKGEVTAYICPFYPAYSGEKIKALLERVPQGKGYHTIYWDGTNDQGQMAPPTSYGYLVAIWSWDLPDNSVITTGTRPEITNVSAEPNYFDPSYHSDEPVGYRPTTVTYTLSKNANVTLKVYDLNNVLIRTITKTNIPADTNTIIWDGRNDSGNLVAAGQYKLGIKAIDTEGNESVTIFCHVVVFY